MILPATMSYQAIDIPGVQEYRTLEVSSRPWEQYPT